MARLNADGSPDRSFGSGGEFIHHFGGADAESYFGGTVLDRAGRVLALASSAGNNGVGPTFVRLRSNGSIDSTFGFQTVPIGLRNSVAGGAQLVMDHGRLLAVGTRIVSPDRWDGMAVAAVTV